METKIMNITDLIRMVEIPFYGTNLKSSVNRCNYAKYYKQELVSLYNLRNQGVEYIEFENGYLDITF